MAPPKAAAKTGRARATALANVANAQKRMRLRPTPSDPRIYRVYCRQTSTWNTEIDEHEIGYYDSYEVAKVAARKHVFDQWSIDQMYAFEETDEDGFFDMYIEFPEGEEMWCYVEEKQLVRASAIVADLMPPVRSPVCSRADVFDSSSDSDTDEDGSDDPSELDDETDSEGSSAPRDFDDQESQEDDEAEEDVNSEEAFTPKEEVKPDLNSDAGFVPNVNSNTDVDVKPIVADYTDVDVKLRLEYKDGMVHCAVGFKDVDPEETPEVDDVPDADIKPCVKVEPDADEEPASDSEAARETVNVQNMIDGFDEIASNRAYEAQEVFEDETAVVTPTPGRTVYSLYSRWRRYDGRPGPLTSPEKVLGVFDSLKMAQDAARLYVLDGRRVETLQAYYTGQPEDGFAASAWLDDNTYLKVFIREHQDISADQENEMKEAAQPPDCVMRTEDTFPGLPRIPPSNDYIVIRLEQDAGPTRRAIRKFVSSPQPYEAAARLVKNELVHELGRDRGWDSVWFDGTPDDDDLMSVLRAYAMSPEKSRIWLQIRDKNVPLETTRVLYQVVQIDDGVDTSLKDERLERTLYSDLHYANVEARRYAVEELNVDVLQQINIDSKFEAYEAWNASTSGGTRVVKVVEVEVQYCSSDPLPSTYVDDSGSCSLYDRYPCSVPPPSQMPPSSQMIAAGV